MKNMQPAAKKTLGWAYGIVAVFTATYLIGGLLLEKANKKWEAIR
ncbi:MAG TPA: hypothetical protein VHZ51_29755 [Ktedonobacteraceae bacterium]|nr:hypothetical protein [Ktedonobacteraceae bacterium]